MNTMLVIREAFELVAVGILISVVVQNHIRLREVEQKSHTHPEIIGKVTEVRENENGIEVSGHMLSEALDAPPKPEWEVKETWFDIDHDHLLDMRIDDWQLFTKKVQQTWINMLRNDGYKIGETLETDVMDYGGLVFGMKKVVFRVKVYKEES